ncbi:N-alpha-acetyl-L-2,4-diaminobutyric acid deacetylase [Kordia antarctica]|uniref:N-alpha-acetyl-L-2,4-diaminobutyric acid deacetylase n=1 Tax=Kordia antarctica TaxID=1218801 RepID=A0A7L4ZN99_9FLAO|nr:succinylglutamate desuccinylase/aspartoacylase family protein [Kordia antarctica]QHI37971.1 N-alpha-acetyl-L-2,4-diaminobutyric acid deacetylase [Kordia antarctica]
MFENSENKIITINGETVKPGEAKWIKIPIDRLPTGTLIEIPIYVCNAEKPGPTLLVQGGLHGDEINGVEIIRRMLFEGCYKIKSGAVIVLPLLNVFGFIHFSRQVPDGKDVNRSFPGVNRGSLATRIAYHVTNEILPQIDFGIDLHTGGSQRNNHPQIRFTEKMPESKKLAEIFNAPIYFATSLIEKSFRETAFNMNIPIIVYEGGESMRFDEYAIKEGVQGILNVMKFMKMIDKIDPILIERKETHLLTSHRWLRAPTAGMFVPQVLNGCSIKKGDVLGLVTNPFATYHKEVKAPYDGFVFCINHQAVVNQGNALFHIGK